MRIQNSLSNRPALILGLIVVVVGLVFFVLNASSRREVAQLRSDAVRLQAELQAANLKAGAAVAELHQRQVAEAGVDTTPAPPSGSSGEATAVTQKPGSKRRVDAEAMSSLLKSPMMQKIMASQTSAVTQITYGHLMDQLQLSPEERDYFQLLLVEKQTSLQNLGMQLMNPGLTEDERSSIMKQLTEAWRGGESRIREFLNDGTDFASYQAYSKQEPERREMGMLAGSLTGSDALDPATSDQLANLQNEARKNFPFTVDFYNQENFGNPAVLNNASVQTFLEEQTQFQAQMAGKAAEMLTPAQLQVYQQNQAAVRQMATMQLNSIVQMAGGR